MTLGKQMAAERGWTGHEWQALAQLWDQESGWNPRAQNPHSGAYGIPQALPGSKMRSAGSDWRTNPRTQIEWGLNYIAGRYGSPAAALNHYNKNNWY
jgi:membrane-bound lytic murein transglycosylase MltF